MAPGALMSSLLVREGFRHAFFTRIGGVSAAPFDSLSFVLGTGDSPANVTENRRRAAEFLGTEPERLFYLSQVHGTDVIDVGDEPPDVVIRRLGDVTISSRPGVACGVRSADCAPVLVADRDTGAVAAVHSGWRGTVARVAQVAVRALSAKTGTSPSAMVAAIGPHIERDQFEVGVDVAAQLAGASSAGADALGRGRDDDHPLVDMRRILRAQLRETGIADEAIDDVPGCTVSRPELFFSYRREGKIGGRLLSAVTVRG